VVNESLLDFFKKFFKGISNKKFQFAMILADDGQWPMPKKYLFF